MTLILLQPLAILILAATAAPPLASFAPLPIIWLALQLQARLLVQPQQQLTLKLTVPAPLIRPDKPALGPGTV